MRKATQKCCGTARSSRQESQFPVPPALTGKSHFLPAHLRALAQEVAQHQSPAMWASTASLTFLQRSHSQSTELGSITPDQSTDVQDAPENTSLNAPRADGACLALPWVIGVFCMA